MPHNFWQSVEHLLLCFPDGEWVPEPILSALKFLLDKLPHTNIKLLKLQKGYYQFFVIDLQSQDLVCSPISNSYSDYRLLIEAMQRFSFDTAIVFTTSSQSPYSIAYLCYLAGIPIRLGQSEEFGGGVLSHTVKPPIESISQLGCYLHLLESAELSLARSEQTVMAIA